MPCSRGTTGWTGAFPVGGAAGRRAAPTLPGRPPGWLARLDLVLGLFAPARIRPRAEQGNELMRLACHGWELFAEVVPPDVADAVLALLDDVGPLAAALSTGPVTLAHGDLATVNMAFEGDDLVLLDWAMPTAAPGALDIARFIAGCAQVVDTDRDDVLADYRAAAGPAHDERSSAGAARRAGMAGLEQGAGRGRASRPGGPAPGTRGPGLVGPGGTRHLREGRAVMDLNTLYARTVEGWAERVNAVPPDRWDDPTPCRDWTVRDLVNHVCGEDLWTAPLVRGQHDRGGWGPLRRGPAGRRPGQQRAGRRRRGHPRRSRRCCPGAAPSTCPTARSGSRSTSTSSPPTTSSMPGTWRSPPAATPGWTRSWSPRSPHGSPTVRTLYRAAGAVGPRGASHGGAQGDLLAAPAATPTGAPTTPPGALLGRVRSRRHRGDHGADDGRLRLRGHRASAGWHPPRGCRGGPSGVGGGVRPPTTPAFTEEETFVAGERGVLRWRFEWTDEEGSPGHVRGVDVLRFRDGKVGEKLSYVKG